MGKRDIIHVPIGDPVGSLGEPPFNVGPMFGFLEGNDELGPIEISAAAWLRVTRQSLGYDGFCSERLQSIPGDRTDVVRRTVFGNSPGECAPGKPPILAR